MKKFVLFASVVAVVFFALGVPFLGVKVAASSAVPIGAITVVLDAGHGGIDVGAVGASGTIESDLNLEYCVMLKSVMEDYGITVVMTRSDKGGLYSEYKNGFKREDMQRRRQIIVDAAPDAVISIHMNKYAASSSHGAQVFYDDEKGTGKALAETLQAVFKKQLPYARSEAQAGDLFMLKCVDKPSILVECGFLSNPDEEHLLLSHDYQKKICLCITSAVLATIPAR